MVVIKFVDSGCLTWCRHEPVPTFRVLEPGRAQEWTAHSWRPEYRNFRVRSGGNPPPEGRNDITGHLTDVASYATGKHEFRFGGEVRQGRVDEFYFRRSLGSFTFDGTQGPWAGTCVATNVLCADTLALADFLASDVSTSSIVVGNAERHVLVNSFAFFGQDAWRATPRLTLNFGLRYEYSGPLHTGDRDLLVFIPARAW
jgi:hypothetical protein